MCKCCGTDVVWGVCASAEGFFVGTKCECGPYVRRGDLLFETRDAAEKALKLENLWVLGEVR